MMDNSITDKETQRVETRQLPNGRCEVLDPVRGRWVALTPEEWVRQHTILQLHQHYGYPLELMQVEGSIRLQGMSRRCDIVVYDRQAHPLVIVECKRETVALTQKVIDQACRYNLVLQVPYLLLTNGKQQIFCQIDYKNGRLTSLPTLPKYHKKS